MAHFGGWRSDELQRLAADGVDPEGYDAYAAYKRSKLAVVALAEELQRQLQKGQVALAIHPGLVDTDLAFGFFRQYLPHSALSAVKGALLRSPRTAAAFVLEGILADGSLVGGAYVVDGQPRRSDRALRRSGVVRDIWRTASVQVGLPPDVHEEMRFTRSRTRAG